MNKSKNVLIIGATSGIGLGLCHAYIARGCKVAVSGRRSEILAQIKAQYNEVFTYTNDVKNFNAAALISQSAQDMGGLDTIIICSGIGIINFALDGAPELDTASTNVCGFTDCAVAGYNYLAKRAAAGQSCRLAGISSIASFRGSDAAPAYYASKAYVSNYLEGLHKKAKKAKLPLKVTTIIPGFVDTVLAQGVGGKEGLFWVAPVPKAVGQIICALDKGKRIVYITKRWRFIAWALKIMPQFLYDKI